MNPEDAQHANPAWLLPFSHSLWPLLAPVHVLAFDATSCAQLDMEMLRFLQSGDSQAAQTLSTLSLRLAAGQAEAYPRAFWCLSAAFFELFGCGAQALDTPFKQLSGQLLLHARQPLAGRKQADSPPDASFLQHLLRLCLRRLLEATPQPSGWPVHKVTPALDAIRHAAYAAGIETIAIHPPDGPAAASATTVRGDLRLNAAEFNLYLQRADEWSQSLLSALHAWSLEPQRSLPPKTLDGLRALAQSSRDIHFVALADLAHQLAQALAQAQPPALAQPASIQLFVRSAEELRRLLHQFAAGFVKTPEPALIEELQALGPVHVQDTSAKAGKKVAAQGHSQTGLDK